MTADLKAAIERMRERAGYGWREFAISSADALLVLAALDQAAEALKLWQDAHESGRYEPCVIAYEHAATVYATLKPADTKEGEGS